jgi:hypothetical protein
MPPQSFPHNAIPPGAYLEPQHHAPLPVLPSFFPKLPFLPPSSREGDDGATAFNNEQQTNRTHVAPENLLHSGNNDDDDDFTTTLLQPHDSWPKPLTTATTVTDALIATTATTATTATIVSTAPPKPAVPEKLPTSNTAATTTNVVHTQEPTPTTTAPTTTTPPLVRREVFSIDQERLAKFEQASWSQYVMEATEIERRRRIDENNMEETLERKKRQEWSRKATAAEQQRILKENSISSMKDTPWFQKMTSSYHDDYIVMCPNAHCGCTHDCPRSMIVQHLKNDCQYSGIKRKKIEGAGRTGGGRNHKKKNSPLNNEFKTIWGIMKEDEFQTAKDTAKDTAKEDTHDHGGDTEEDASDAVSANANDWILMCPYSMFGCVHECKRQDLNDHLSHCSFRGITREEEKEMRRQSTVDAVQVRLYFGGLFDILFSTFD